LNSQISDLPEDQLPGLDIAMLYLASTYDERNVLFGSAFSLTKGVSQSAFGPIRAASDDLQNQHPLAEQRFVSRRTLRQ